MKIEWPPSKSRCFFLPFPPLVHPWLPRLLTVLLPSPMGRGRYLFWLSPPPIPTPTKAAHSHTILPLYSLFSSSQRQSSFPTHLPRHWPNTTIARSPRPLQNHNSSHPHTPLNRSPKSIGPHSCWVATILSLWVHGPIDLFFSSKSHTSFQSSARGDDKRKEERKKMMKWQNPLDSDMWAWWGQNPFF